MLNLLKSATQQTLAGRFRDLCFVGLNRVEIYSHGSSETLQGDSWQDTTDEQTRRRMALIFFAPRELDGEPMSPYRLLSEDPDDEEAVHTTEHILGNMPLIDLCRITPAQPNTVNFLVIADTIFYWDINDNYVLPTTQYTWVKDIQRILKTYPKSVSALVYSNWDDAKLGDLGVPIKPLNTFPLDLETWVNIPTFQEKNGTMVLLASFVFMGLAWAGLHFQASHIDTLSEEMRITQQKIPREGKFTELSRFMLEQEKYMQYREIYPWIVKDVAHAIEQTQMVIEGFEVSNPTPLEPNAFMIATIEAERDAYKGWLQEEPIAKDVLLTTASFKAVRKPPGNSFKLEGLIDLKEASKAFHADKTELEKDTAVNVAVSQAEEPSAPQSAADISSTTRGETNE